MLGTSGQLDPVEMCLRFIDDEELDWSWDTGAAAEEMPVVNVFDPDMVLSEETVRRMWEAGFKLQVEVKG